MPLPDGTIYLDHSATTPTDPRVLQAMLPYFTDAFGNASSIYALGRRSHQALDDARSSVASVLHCQPTEVIFTGGGSEGDNLAIKGIAFAARRRGNHIVTTAIEHHAVLHTCQQLEHLGYEVTYIRPDGDGKIAAADVERVVRDDTALVSVMYANNEVGTVEPIEEIGEICRARRIPFHVDAVQAGPYLDLDVQRLQVDLLTLSAHKFYGPKGVGILFARQGSRLQPQIVGGSQERNRRAGTENVPGIVGAAEALRLAQAERLDDTPRLRDLRDKLIAGVLALPAARLTGHPVDRLPNHASFAFEQVEGESLLLSLDLRGIAASSGSACSTGAVDPSHVLSALGLNRSEARGHLRMTLGRSSSDADVDSVLTALPEMLTTLRALATSAPLA